MGITNPIVFPFYKEKIKPQGEVALLGFSNNDLFDGDLYDRSIGNWDINSDWTLCCRYDTIICTRCAYFAKNPLDFVQRCHNSLNDKGRLFVDWGLGDHWRFKEYKVGWIKNGEQEYAYGRENYLWSCVWDDSFLENKQCLDFAKAIKSKGYGNLKEAVMEEVPVVVPLESIQKYFTSSVHFLTIEYPYLMMYILVCGEKI